MIQKHCSKVLLLLRDGLFTPKDSSRDSLTKRFNNSAGLQTTATEPCKVFQNICFVVKLVNNFLFTGVAYICFNFLLFQ